MKVIINADDYGISEGTTREIQKAIERGLISSSTIMANGRYLNESLPFIREHPEISWGIHVNLTSFESLTKSPALRKAGLIDNAGQFIKSVYFSTHRFDKIVDRGGYNAVYQEITDQTQRLLDLGIPLSHADGHHHCQTNYGIQVIFSKALHQFNINKIRLAQTLTFKERYYLINGGISSLPQIIGNPINKIQNRKLNNYYKDHFTTTDRFMSYNACVELLKKDSSVLKQINTIELMTHVGGTHKKDKELLYEQPLKGLLDYELINYNSL